MLASISKTVILHLPEEFFALSFTFQPEIVNAIRQLNKRRIKERASFSSLFQEMSDAESGLWVCMGQTFVRSVHAGRNTLRLADLVTAREAPVEDLDNKDSKIIGIDGRHRTPFDAVPATFSNLGRGIASRIRGKASICLNVMISRW